MGQQIPESWVQFEKILTNLVDRGIIYARVEEVRPTTKIASKVLQFITIFKRNNTSHARCSLTFSDYS
jgi:hypothetical protein